MQAIITKYIGPTNSRCSRIKATAAAGSITVDFDYGLDYEENHTAAAQKLAAKFGWTGKWVQGCLHTGDYVHTRVAEWTEYTVAERSEGTPERSVG